MNDRDCRRFAESLRSLSPDMKMSAGEIGAALKTQGLDGFIQSAGSHVAGLAEIAELLSRMEKEGIRHESG